MAKYDWKKLEKEYILSDFKSVSGFLKSKGIKRNGSVQKSVKGWKNKRVQKETKKSSKIIEKTIEKEAEAEAQQIVDLKAIATNLALQVLQSTTELNKHIAKSVTKNKTIQYDYKVGKPRKEVIEENEDVTAYESIIDRQGLKFLASALKDLNEIINGKSDPSDNTQDKLQTYLDKLEGAFKNG